MNLWTLVSRQLEELGDIMKQNKKTKITIENTKYFWNFRVFSTDGWVVVKDKIVYIYQRWMECRKCTQCYKHRRSERISDTVIWSSSLSSKECLNIWWTLRFQDLEHRRIMTYDVVAMSAAAIGDRRCISLTSDEKVLRWSCCCP